MSLKLLTYDVYRSGMTLFKDLADQTYQDKAHLPAYYLRKLSSSELPAGYDAMYGLYYRVAGVDHAFPMGEKIGIIGSKGGGIIQAYIVDGAQEGSIGWLTDTPGGEPFIPDTNFLYLILTPGIYYNTFYRFIATSLEPLEGSYSLILEARGDGAIISYEVSGSTRFSPGWLTDVNGHTAKTPKDGIFYLDATAGSRYFNWLFRFDSSVGDAGEYVPVAGSVPEVIKVQERSGAALFSPAWFTDGKYSNASITPVEGQLYLNVTDNSRYKNMVFRFDSSVGQDGAYVAVAGSAEDVVNVYKVANQTEFSATWLTDNKDSRTFVPDTETLYLFLTPGERYTNWLFRFNGTNYVPVAGSEPEVVFVTEIQNATALSSGWFKDTLNIAVSPKAGVIYVDLTAGKYFNRMFRFDGSNYVPLSGGGSGIVFSYEISGQTQFSPSWLTDVSGSSSPLEPDTDLIYMDMSAGKFKNCLFRFVSTASTGFPNGKYMLISDNGFGTIFVEERSGVEAFNARWFADIRDHSEVTPEIGRLYLNVTANSKYENYIFRFDGTSYVSISGGGSGTIFATENTASGVTKFAPNWLKDLDNEVIEPEVGYLYLDISSGKYENFIFRFDETPSTGFANGKYIPVSGAGGGIINAYIVGNTPYSNTWLSETPGGSPLEPDDGQVYLVLTAGQHYSAFYRFDASVGTNGTYMLVGNARVVDITKAEYLDLPQAKQLDGTIYFITDSASTAPAKDDYLPSRVSVPANPVEGTLIVWKGAVSSTFPVSPAVYRYNGSAWEQNNLGIEGQVIQVDTIPTPTADLEDRVIQYVGASGNGYVHNFFYECLYVSNAYRWVNTKVQAGDEFQVTVMPAASADYAGKVFQYLGASNQTYTHNYFYECKNSGSTYYWENVKVQPGDQFQFTTMPAASADYAGKVFQYIGVTDANYTHNFWYECIGSGSSYSWVAQKVQPGDEIQYTTMPAASADLVGKVYQYIGTTNANFIYGHFYECINTLGVYSWRSVGMRNVVKDDGMALADRSGLNFIDFDLADNSASDATDIKMHEITPSEWNDVFSILPGYPTVGVCLDKRGTEYVVGYIVEANGDEKALYLKTITGTTISSGTYGTISTGLNSANISLCWIEMFLVVGTGYTKDLLDSVSITNNGASIYMLCDEQSVYRNKPFVAAIYYTKVND